MKIGDVVRLKREKQHPHFSDLWADDNQHAGYIYRDEIGFVVEMCLGAVKILCGGRLAWISECWIEVVNDSSQSPKNPQ
jgi:hypothetical protein